MTAIDRTAYPRPGERLTREELQARYHLTETDRTFIRAVARGDAGRLTLAALLKTRRDSGRFPSPREIPGTVLSHLAAQLGMAVPPPLVEENRGKQTLHRYRTAIRAHLGSTAFSKVGEGVVTRAVLAGGPGCRRDDERSSRPDQPGHRGAARRPDRSAGLQHA